MAQCGHIQWANRLWALDGYATARATRAVGWGTKIWREHVGNICTGGGYGLVGNGMIAKNQRKAVPDSPETMNKNSAEPRASTDARRERGVGNGTARRGEEEKAQTEKNVTRMESRGHLARGRPPQHQPAMKQGSQPARRNSGAIH